jgi:hypothetical protein
MNPELLEKLKKDLEKSGLGSELKVRQSFEKRGWSVYSGGAYLDKDDNKSREIDISATLGRQSRKGKTRIFSNWVTIYAEIKKTEKPWIIFKSKLPKYKTTCAWNNLIHAVNLPCEPHKLVRLMSKNSLLIRNGWLGTGIHEAFKKPDQPSRWYGAFTTTLKACESYLESCQSENTTPTDEKQTDSVLKNPASLEFIQPLVILDGILVSAELSEDNEILLEEICSAAFEFEYRTPSYCQLSYRIDLTTLDSLDEYLSIVEKRQKDISDGLDIFCKKQIEGLET